MAVEPQLLAAWCRMWALSRGVAPPTFERGGLRTVVGELGQQERWVFSGPCAEARVLAETIDNPDVLVKICATAAEVEALLPPSWVLHQPRNFTTAVLEPHSRDRRPGGYQYEIIAQDWSAAAIASDSEGRIVGRVGILCEGDLAVIDRLQVDEIHRRRGIGERLVALAHSEALRLGATRGALVATAQGTHLYERFGWTVVSAYTTASLRG